MALDIAEEGSLKFVGSKVRVALTYSKVEFGKDGEKIAIHKRRYGQEDSLSLDHYLDQLQRKPGAFSYAKASKQATFDPNLTKIRDRLSDKYGNTKANAIGINPEKYFEDIMKRLMSHNSQKLHELLPDEWAKARASLDTS